MELTVKRNRIDVIGQIWQPGIGTCAMTYNLSSYDIDNIGETTRDNVEHWLSLKSGDFQSIDDFHAVVGETEIPWSSEEGEFTFQDCMCSQELAP